MFKLRGRFFIIIFCAFLSLFFYANISQAAYQSPSSDPVGGNDLSAFIYNDLGDNDIYILNNSFGIGGNFTVDDDLFVKVSSSRVGIGADTPEASLDVDGVVRVPTAYLANFPTCISSLEGTFMFNLNQDRLNICFNGDWRRIGYDGDLDGWLDYQDCNDSDPNIHPGATEICGDDVDDNCDGSKTVGCNLCYRDYDGDGYGDVTDYIWVNPGVSCASSGRVDDSTDCNDNNPNINPGATEICNDTVDDDCDTSLTNTCSYCEADVDNDNYGGSAKIWQKSVDCPDYLGDCNDNNSSIRPGIAEVCGDDVDDNCDGSKTLGCSSCYRDNDGDGYGDPSNSFWANPGESCASSGGADNSSDCDDNDPSRNPASEVCGDMVSNDCDALVNEGCPCTSSEWTALSCPDASSCNNSVNLTATKLTNCSGWPPTLSCECTCRTEHFYSPVPPVCPVCRSDNTTIYATKLPGVTCTDNNSISDTYCPDNCSGYCSGDTCCNHATYSVCEDRYSVHYNACGEVDASTYCAKGCLWGTCNGASDGSGSCAAPATPSTCTACGGSWSQYPPPSTGGACIMTTP